MKVAVSEHEVNRVPVDAVSLALQKLPYNGQDEQDTQFAKLFLYKTMAKQVNGPLDKIEDKLKKNFRDGGKKVLLSQNYRVECNEGTPRELFDFDTFAKNIIRKYPEVESFVLRELYAQSKISSTAPVSVVVEYIGDTRHGQ